MTIQIRTTEELGFWKKGENAKGHTCDICGKTLSIAPDGKTTYCDNRHDV